MSVNERIISELIERGHIIEISRKIPELKNNEEKVLYLYGVMENLNLFPGVLNVKKDKDRSICYRNLGNNCYRESNYFDAWQYYNLALLHAPYDSDEYAIALSNRSAVFFALKMYNECLNDIKDVMSRKFPDNLVQKLTKRSALCEQTLSEQCSKDIDDDNGIKSIFTVQGPRNERYVCASSKVEVVFTEKMGRHIVAKEDISAGEVIARESPYMIFLLKSHFLICCSFCLSQSPNLMPCDSCCFSLYCSKDCKERALKEYHAVECPIIATLTQSDFTPIEVSALRTVIRARTEHGSWNELFETVKAANMNMKTKFKGHVEKDGKWLYDSKYYASVYTLPSNVEQKLFLLLLENISSAAVFLKLLEVKTTFLNVSKDEDEKRVRRLVAGLLVHHCTSSFSNTQDISSNYQSADGKISTTNIATASYAFLSLLKHSCFPNVVRYSSLGNRETVLFALRPIAKGMQLYDNYELYHAADNLSLESSQQGLQDRFRCYCDACVQRWPRRLPMQHPKDLPFDLLIKIHELCDKEVIMKLMRGDKATAVKVFKPLCDLFEDFAPNTRSLEMSRCQEYLMQCIKIFGGYIPYNFPKLLECNVVPIKR